MKNTVAIVQARMNSSRLPGKVMMEIEGKPVIGILLERLSLAKTLDSIVVATTDKKEDDILVDYIESIGYKTFRGGELDVLDRYYQAALEHNATEVVRITGDCPIIDPGIVDEVVSLFFSNEVDYASNTMPPTFPDGLDVAVCSFDSLKLAWSEAEGVFDREHVMPFLKKSLSINKINLTSNEDFSNHRWTLDEPEDLVVISNILHNFSPDILFSWMDVIRLFKKEPELFKNNKKIKRNEGAFMKPGQKLWERAKKVIPGGNMLLSKRPEMYLPNGWPSYYSKAQGCSVWDLEGNEFIDMSIMGIGTNILGYNHPEVNASVIEAVNSGNMSTLNCPEEVILAEKLVENNPWSDMVRFARTGGEANSIAIRIARAASGKDKVAVCGYHGWHDWYLSINLTNKKGLDGHLLPGLEPNGVPKSLRDSTIPFDYNDFEGLQNLIANNPDIGIIKMEVMRNEEPENNFLSKVRDLASSKNIILIFDECTSGFRETFGGLHKKYNIEPDMAVFGKALGNGYAITAVVGKKEIMESAQNSFISSTFWTERIGPVAGISTMDVMQDLKSWETITSTGLNIKKIWSALATEHSLPINIFGLPATIKFSFNLKNNLKYKTLICQEMLKKGFLASNSVYVCIQHTDDILSRYAEELNKIFKLISDCETGLNIDDLLEGPVAHDGFKRLN